MQDAITPSGTPTIPPYLLELPESVVKTPPVETRIHDLPFDKLSWRNFERLVFQLVRKNSDVEYCAPYGRSGQTQDGIDVYARLSGGGHVCWQVKNRKRVTASKIKKATDDFLKGKWANSAKRFVLCVRASLADTGLQDAIEAQAARLLEKGIVFEAVDGTQLSELLRPHPDIVDNFFGRDWLVAFAGEEAAASLRRPLEVEQVIALRRRLAEFYEARFQHLDPGLNVDPALQNTPDIRKRFVVPHVDPENPFLEPSLESEDWPTEASGPDDEEAWEFDDYGNVGKPTISRRPPSEPSAALPIALDGWLLQSGRALLLSGPPGSGKSTVLRCLALDLLHTPELFPAISDRLGERIPLLIPFALWSRLVARKQGEVRLSDVIRETFGASVPQKLEDSFIEALFDDERLVLLIDGLDEYGDEQAARTTLATIDTFVRAHDIFTVMTARPAGLRRLDLVSGRWKTARLMELLPRQQRDFALKLLSEEDRATTPVALRVDHFFQQLEHNGRLQSLAGNPLLLHGLLSVAARQIILPNTRFHLFEKLIDILLEVHPNRRATAAAEVKSRTRAFSTEDVRSRALAKLAFEVQTRGADAGIDRGDARHVIENFLADQDDGPAWSKEQARLGAGELTNVDADTSGLLVERAPKELAFCHAAFREHLAGLELAAWTLEDQVTFVSSHAGEPRWRGAILALLQSLNRRTDVERILGAIQGEHEREPASTDRRLLLAEGAFAMASLSGPIGRQAALDSLSRIETGTNDAERLELLGLALDGPRHGPIGEAIITRLGRWWPGIAEFQSDLYAELGRWKPTEDLAQTLLCALRGDSDQLAASSSLAKAFGGDHEVGCQLISLAHDSMNPWVTAAALDALSRGWPSTDGLDDWLYEAERSQSVQMRMVAALALYRRGRQGDEGRNSLLSVLGTGWNRFEVSLHSEIVDALTTGWAGDSELHDVCWECINWNEPRKYYIEGGSARSILMRLHREDSRVADWLQMDISRSDHFPFSFAQLEHDLLASILSEHSNVCAAVESRFKTGDFKFIGPEAARVAAALGRDSAKQVMLSGVTQAGMFRFWPVVSLLQGWGMDDPEVAAALKEILSLPPNERQHIAHLIPEINGSDEESFRLLVEICDLQDLKRADFVARGFAELDRIDDENTAVSALLPHVVRIDPIGFQGADTIISRFPTDPRVRAFALERLQKPSPPLAAMAGAYATDREIAPLILRSAAPLPKVFRRYIARRASQRFDDMPLRSVLEQCDLDTDEHAMVQATIGRSHAALATLGDAQEITKVLSAQLHVIGPDLDRRRAAAFGGLLALGRGDVFLNTKDERTDEPHRINLIDTIHDYAPVLELVAERWEELESDSDGTLLDRLIKYDSRRASFWRSFVPYLGRSSGLTNRFLEYCEDESELPTGPALMALSRLRPGSRLLLDCCKRVLGTKYNDQKWSPLDAAQSTVAASKCLAAHFAEDHSANESLKAASNSLQVEGAALVGLASQSPDHEVIVREYRKPVEEYGWPRLLVCAELWLLSAQGTPEQVANALAWFVTRRAPSPWDFPEDALDAFRARLQRDPEIEDTLSQFARENDEPSIRASTVRLLASTSASQSQPLAHEFLAAECRRLGPPRFALDILTNRIRPARELMREGLTVSYG